MLLVAIVGLLLRWEGLVADWLESPDDPRLRARADRGIVLAAAVFRSWVFGASGSTISDDRITAELEQLMMHGVRGRSAQ